jgi:TolB-like protein/class 3 adenylate cyclase/Tfp pilus assembly protein PilF
VSDEDPDAAPPGNTAVSKPDLHLEIAHVLYIDIVGYSKRSINEQRAAVDELTSVVRGSEQFQKAEAAGKLVKIPAGDGMALVFHTSPEGPVQCAMEISRALKNHPKLQLRMGVHSGPISGLVDVTERANVAGAGINVAQRVMDCGDAGHILLSQRVAEDLDQYDPWRPLLHDLGTCEVKHGMRVGVVNLYGDEFGNPQLPKKFQTLQKHRARLRWGALATALLLLSAIVAAFVIVSRRPTRSTSTIMDKSVAVLPFENLSTDEENAFFASGVQDEILSNLAKIADLKVISRTSVMNYKSRAGRNLREIAKALGVAHVVEGSVQRAGGKVRVNAQLIDARSDRHVWADHYDRDLADVFAIQSEIAQQIAGQLRAKLSPEEKAAIDERPTADLKAYALYSEAKAIEVWDYEPQKNLLRKVALLEQAIERDPKFALAWCALAKLQTDLAEFENQEAHLAAAKKAAETAVQLRPDMGQPHLALAYYYLGTALGPRGISTERARAYEELSIARRTLPNDAQLFRILGELDRRRNRWDDSLAELRQAYALDPLNGEIQYHLALNYRLMRLYAEGEKFQDGLDRVRAVAAKQGEKEWDYLNRAELKLDAGDPAAAHSFLAKVPDTFSPTEEIWETRFNTALYLRDYDAAGRVLAAIPAEIATGMFDGQPPQSWADGLIARARGDQQKAQAIYSAIREKMNAKWAGLPQRDIEVAKAARIDAGLGRKEEAISEGRRAVELRPIAQDSLFGPDLVRTLALVYAWTGESALAIEQLEIIAKIPAGPSYGELRFDPTWDSLRGDSRFEKIVASLAPKK